MSAHGTAGAAATLPAGSAFRAQGFGFAYWRADHAYRGAIIRHVGRRGIPDERAVRVERVRRRVVVKAVVLIAPDSNDDTIAIGSGLIHPALAAVGVRSAGLAEIKIVWALGTGRAFLERAWFTSGLARACAATLAGLRTASALATATARALSGAVILRGLPGGVRHSRIVRPIAASPQHQRAPPHQPPSDLETRAIHGV